MSSGGRLWQCADSCIDESKCGWRLRGAMGLMSAEVAFVLSGCVLMLGAGWVWMMVG